MQKAKDKFMLKHDHTMKAYISVDMEGMPGIYHVAQTAPKAFLHSEGRDIVTRITLLACEKLHANGVESITVADSHWYMGNIYYEKLPDYVNLIRGSLRPVSMVYGIEEGYDFAIFLGYHSPAGTMHSILDHTYSGLSFSQVRVNGRKASEFYINALYASEKNVPVILVAGDDRLGEDVKEISPSTEYVVTKMSISRASASMIPISRVEEQLGRALENSLKNFKEGKIKAIPVPNRLVFEFVMRESEFADAGELIPGIERVDTYTLKYVTGEIGEGYRVMQLLAMVSSYVDTSIQSLR
ncbi:MAG: M55 family metallopeptidase [Thermoplasmatales archaeon]|nr:M55 family metallopeptidase [Thermoplasmatales archaeon]